MNMTSMVPGFTPMQFAAPQANAGQSQDQLTQSLLQAALKRQPATQATAQAQPGVKPDTTQMGLLGKLFSNASPAAPTGMLTDSTGFSPKSVSGLW